MSNSKPIKLHPFVTRGNPELFDRASLMAFCESNHLRLPDDYIAFLEGTNGGRVDHRQTVSVKTRGPRSVSLEIHSFYPSAPGNAWEGLEAIWKASVELDLYPRYLVPFADTVPHSKLYFKVIGPMQGSVVYVNERRANLNIEIANKDLELCKGVYSVALSFTEFWNKLEITDAR